MELVTLVARSSVVLGATLALAFACRRRSAALRHFVLAAGLATAGLMVPLSNVVPTWVVEVPQAWELLVPVVASPGTDGGVSAGVATVNVASPAAGRVAWRPLLTVVWLAGVLWLAVPFVSGLVGLRRLSRHASELRDSRWQAVLRDVAARLGVTRRVRLLESAHATGTWGVAHPRVVVPSDSLGWDDERLRTVLTHELAHVRRGDWAVQTVADVMRVAFWFNPLFWVAVRQLRDESERACDDVVLEAGVPDAAYAAHLLEIARANHQTAPAAVMAMARMSTLEGRIAAMLNPSVDRRVPSRLVRLVTIALLVVVASAAAVRLAAQAAGPAALEGFVYDSSGGVLPAVELALENDQGVKWTTPTDGKGRFEFAPVGAGKYVLEATIAGFQTFRQPVVLERAKDWKRVITLQVGELQETINVTGRRPKQATPPPSSATNAGVVRVGGNIKQPRKVADARPVYPPDMQAAGLEGVVRLDALIATDGTVSSVRPVGAQVHPDFVASAAAAVKQWKFTPTLLNGAPVEVVMTVSVSFTLAD